jgi:hypothetical protein
VYKIVSNRAPRLEDDLDTSTPVMTPTDAEDRAMAGRPYPKPRASALIMMVVFFGFFLLMFAFAAFFIYGNNKQNGLAEVFVEPTVTPAIPPGAERVQPSVISVSPVVSSENFLIRVPMLNSGLTPQTISVTVTAHYTGANLTLRVTDEPNRIPTPVEAKAGAGTPTVAPPSMAPIQSVSIKMVFYNQDGSATGNWLSSVGPIPLGGSKDFTITIAPKPGLGKWDGKGQVVATVYAILTTEGK